MNASHKCIHSHWEELPGICLECHKIDDNRFEEYFSKNAEMLNKDAEGWGMRPCPNCGYPDGETPTSIKVKFTISKLQKRPPHVNFIEEFIEENEE